MVYIPPGGGDVRPPLGKPNAEILPQTFESGNHEPNCHGSMDRRMAETVSLERNAPTSLAITRKDPALPHRPRLKSYAMRLRRRYKTGLFYERFSTPDLLCGQRRPLQNPSPASGRDKRGPPVSSQHRKDSPVFGNATLPYLRKTAKIRRFSGGPRLSRPRERWAASGG